MAKDKYEQAELSEAPWQKRSSHLGARLPLHGNNDRTTGAGQRQECANPADPHPQAKHSTPLLFTCTEKLKNSLTEAGKGCQGHPAANPRLPEQHLLCCPCHCSLHSPCSRAELAVWDSSGAGQCSVCLHSERILPRQGLPSSAQRQQGEVLSDLHPAQLLSVSDTASRTNLNTSPECSCH